MNIGTLTASLVLNTSRFTKPLVGAQQRMKKFAVGLRTMSRDMANAGMRLSMFVTAPIIGLGTAMVKASSAATETKQKFDVVFQGMGRQAEQVAKGLAKNWDLASQSVQEHMSTSASFFQGMGFGRRESLGLSKSVVGLAGDITSFLDLSDGVEGAMKRMVSGMAGNSRAMRELKVVYTQGEEKFEKLKAHLKSTRGLTDTQARALTVLKFAFKQSKNAIGDYARTSGSTANRMRALVEAFKDFKVVVGDFLVKTLRIPQRLKWLADEIRKLGKWFQKVPEPIKRFATLALLAAAAIGPLLVATSTILFSLTALVTSLSWVVRGFAGFVTVIGFLTSPLGLLIAGIATLVTKFWLLRDSMKIEDRVGNIFDRMKRGVRSLVKGLIKAGPYIAGFFINFKENARILMDWFQGNWKVLAKNMGRVLLTAFNNTLHNLGVMWRFALRSIGIITRILLIDPLVVVGLKMGESLTRGIVTAFQALTGWLGKWADETFGLSNFFGGFLVSMEVAFEHMKKLFTEGVKIDWDAMAKEIVIKQAEFDKQNPEGNIVGQSVEEIMKGMELGGAAPQARTLGQATEEIRKRILETWPEFAPQLKGVTDGLTGLEKVLLPWLRFTGFAPPIPGKVKKGGAQEGGAGAGGPGGPSVSKIGPAAKFGSMEAFKIGNSALLKVQNKIEKHTKETAKHIKIVVLNQPKQVEAL